MFIYETHLHTSQGSACGKSEGKEYIQKYIDAGYDGIIVTDHFFHGNCAVSPDLPWQERVKQFCRGYEDAKNEGDKRGLKVFFGWEQRYKWDEYLIYGPQKDWLLEHPEIETASRTKQLELIHQAGGCVVQAHPFRQREYITVMDVCPYLVDGIEGCNAGNKPEADILAMKYACKMGLFASAGSDIHKTDAREGDSLFGVAFSSPLTNAFDYAQAICTNKPHTLRVPVGYAQWDEQALTTIETPLHILGRKGEVISSDIKMLLY